MSKASVQIISAWGAAAMASCLVLAGCGASSTSASAPSATQTASAASASKPAHVGDCVDTTVASIGSRLEGAPDSGSAIQYANGIGQTSYDAVPGITHSQAGDAVHVCLVSVPENCPPNDDRGRVYSAVNARTHETWSAPDSEHMCGGA